MLKGAATHSSANSQQCLAKHREPKEFETKIQKKKKKEKQTVSRRSRYIAWKKRIEIERDWWRWDSTDRIMIVGQRGVQLLGLPSDFGRVMSASDSSSVPSFQSLTGFLALLFLFLHYQTKLFPLPGAQLCPLSHVHRWFPSVSSPSRNQGLPFSGRDALRPLVSLQWSSEQCPRLWTWWMVIDRLLPVY